MPAASAGADALLQFQDVWTYACQQQGQHVCTRPAYAARSMHCYGCSACAVRYTMLR